jgi:hypothetical protein
VRHRREASAERSHRERTRATGARDFSSFLFLSAPSVR